MTRRYFLRGVAGVVVGLPFLEGLSPRRAGAGQASSKFAVFVRQGNGVQQATDSGEPERFWPSFAPGAFTPEALAADTGRALSELADHAKDSHHRSGPPLQRSRERVPALKEVATRCSRRRPSA